MAHIAQPSVQSLLIEMQFNGQALSTGTAFIVQTAKGPHLVTNRHNVTGRHRDTNAQLSPTGGVPRWFCQPHWAQTRPGTLLP